MFNVDFFSKTIMYLDYWKQDPVEKRGNEDESPEEYKEKLPKPEKFIINQPGECTSNNNYGFNQGKPCVLVKMNKVK
jgi:hypothetical protein